MNMMRWKTYFVLSLVSIFLFNEAKAQQHSVARKWNEVLLTAIRNDFARPTVHARNLWHTSVAIYDAWAAYEENADNFLLGENIHGYNCPFSGIPSPTDRQAAQEEAMSYAVYRILRHRFQFSPGAFISFPEMDTLFLYELGYDSSFHSTNYSTGSAAALGNYIAQEIIAFGQQDGSNEQIDYANTYYLPVNPPLLPMVAGNPDIVDPNRWQPLTLSVFVDQAGNVFPISTPPFLSPEWGNVVPFALDSSDMMTVTRDGNNYNIFHNVVNPPRLDTINGGPESDEYKWGFRLVNKWSAHLDTTDGVLWDISPNNIGNVPWYPSTIDSLRYFYDEENGGDNGIGYSVNPATGQPYATQIVPRADYARVLAEFWADGPDSETPPGHWFTILNYVSDHAQFEKRWKGQGPILDDLEWDVKAYFTLSGTMHDAAIAAWSLKGYEDYIRPISAIRYMCDQGQSSDPALPSYSINGIELDSGYVELVDSLDPLAGANYEHVGKIKLYAWNGPDSISDPATDMAGVGWILAEHWWPYQRPTFVTPNFAGFVSGHSTYSRAAADVMTAMTGDPYFPGGMAEFFAPQNDFLVFEEGPSVDVHLQWATYRDASDQCSLSRIWGGIHPPADDIPGRLLGMEIAVDAYELARSYWDNEKPDVVEFSVNKNLITDADVGSNLEINLTFDEDMDTTATPQLAFPVEDASASFAFDHITWNSPYSCTISYNILDDNLDLDSIDLEISAGLNTEGVAQTVFTTADQIRIETRNPLVNITPSVNTISSNHLGVAGFSLTLVYDELVDTTEKPQLSFPVEDPMNTVLVYNQDSSRWISQDSFIAFYDVLRAFYIQDIDVLTDQVVSDTFANLQVVGNFPDLFSVTGALVSAVNDNAAVAIQLLPNPISSGEVLQLELKGLSGQYLLEIFDLQGRLMLSKSWENQNIIQIPTEGLTAGQYLLQITTDQGNFQEKLIIK
jgi:hypothetical protein